MDHANRPIARLLMVMIALANAGANAATIEIRPLGGSGNDITVLAGTQVTLEIFVSDYAPSLIMGYQVDLDPAGWSNGVGVDLVPFVPPCTSSPECAAELGTGATCDSPTHPPGCTAGFIDGTRSDYLFASITDIPSAYGNELHDYRWGGAAFPAAGAADSGGLSYLATLVVDVPIGATGTYTLGLDPIPDTTLQDLDGLLIPDITLVPANIVVSGSIPAMGTWGLTLMALVLLAVATILLTRRRSPRIA